MNTVDLSIFDAIEKAIKIRQVSYNRYSADSEFDYERINVYLTDPDDYEDFICEIRVIDEFSPKKIDDTNKPIVVVNKIYHVIFTTVFKIYVNDNSVTDMHRIVSFINSKIKMNGFVFYEDERKIVFRYVWLLCHGYFDYLMFNNIISINDMFFNMYKEAFSYVNDGVININKLLLKD